MRDHEFGHYLGELKSNDINRFTVHIYEHGICVGCERIKNSDLLPAYYREEYRKEFSLAEFDRIRGVIEAVHGKTLKELAWTEKGWGVVDLGVRRYSPVYGAQYVGTTTITSEGHIAHLYKPCEHTGSLFADKASAERFAEDIYQSEGWDCVVEEWPKGDKKHEDND